MQNKFSIASLVLILSLLMISSCSLITKDVPLIPREILFGNPEKASPTISPDGTQLAYLAPHNGVLNAWVKTVEKNNAQPVTNEEKRPIHYYFWTPDSDHILYLQDTNGNENYHIFSVDIKNNTILDLTPFDNVKAGILAIDKHFPNTILITLNKENPALFDAYSLNLSTGTLTLVAKNPSNVLAWLADNNLQVRAAIATHPDGSQSLLTRPSSEYPWKEIVRVGFEDTFKDDLYCALLHFSHDNNFIYLNTSIDSNTRRLIKLDSQTGKYTVIAQDPEYDLEWVDFNSDTNEPEIICWDKERADFQILEPELQKDFANAQKLSSGIIDTIQKNSDGSIWVIGYQHDNKSYEYYLYDRATGQSTFLFFTRPELNKFQLAQITPISLTSRDGLTLHGYLTIPVHHKPKLLPMVLFVHGGPFSRDSWGYNSSVQWLANRGYAVLQINFRGSSGYGKKFLAAGNLEWGGKMQDDLTDAVQWAIDSGIADPKKIAIFGGSYGGYAALVGATFTPDLYACCIDYVGPSNLITVLQTLPPYWSKPQWEQRIGQSSDEEFLKSRSPLFKIEHLKIPVFVAHGANDPRVKQAESEQIVQALKEKNLPHEYLLFTDEGHGFLKPKNKLKFYAAMEKFLAQHLGGKYEE